MCAAADCNFVAKDCWLAVQECGCELQSTRISGVSSSELCFCADRFAFSLPLGSLGVALLGAEVAKDPEDASAGPEPLPYHGQQSNGWGGIPIRVLARIICLVAVSCATCPLENLGGVQLLWMLLLG